MGKLYEWFRWNSGNPVFDIVETLLYYDIPRLFGTEGTVVVKGNTVFIDYTLREIISAARPLYDYFPKTLIRESLQYKDSLYMYSLGTYYMDPLEAIITTYKFYAPQQILRVVFTKIAERELGVLKIPIWVVRPDRQMEMHSDIPAHRSITYVGYTKYERNHFTAKPNGVTRDFLSHLEGRSWDYTLAAVWAAYIVAWAEYFAETEDAYVFGSFKRVSKETGITRATHELLLDLKDRIPAPKITGQELQWIKVKREIQLE